VKKFFKTLRIIAAIIFIIIGIAGLIIPVFPTVPFLIVAALLMGKKPAEVIRFIDRITKNIQLKIKKTIRRFQQKRLKKTR
jgi:uncharacterized membrane protein YbaN (DUF454 family)